jgi:phosphoribosyl 1,2-cyclic phosphodiesterase
MYPLGSGSTGNALAVSAGGVRVLVDAGFGPLELTRRLAAAALLPEEIDAVLLTHTHSDHTGASARWCLRHGVRLIHDERNTRALARGLDAYVRLRNSGLLWTFDSRPFELGGLVVEPFDVPHDAKGMTCGFAIAGGSGRGRWRAAVATDLGAPEPGLAALLADSDILVLESNHDPGMLAASGRPAWLRRRIAGPRGHLSNDQSGSLLEEVLARSSRAPRVVALAHLSLECNAPELALETAFAAMESSGASGVRLMALSPKPAGRITLG